MEVWVPFLMATLANSILGVDGAVLADVQVRKLGLVERWHFWTRSLTLFVAACVRLGMIFAVAQLAFLLEPQTDHWWLPNRWFSEHPDELVWRHLLLFLGAGVATNGFNCALLAVSVADADLITVGGPDEESWEAEEMAAGLVTVAYAGGCLFAGNIDSDPALEALVIGASIKFTTGFTGTRL